MMRRNRDLPAVGTGREFANVVSFLGGALLMLCAMLVITGGRL